MKIKNPFFKIKKNVYLSEILSTLGKEKISKDIKINNIANLESATTNDISFINNLKYLDLLKKTKANYIITNNKYLSKIKNYCHPIIVSDVLKSVYKILKKKRNFYYDNSDC